MSALSRFMQKLGRERCVPLGRLPAGGFAPLETTPEATALEGIAALHCPRGALESLNDSLDEQLSTLGAETMAVVLDMEGITELGEVGMTRLRHLPRMLKRRGIKTYFAGACGPLMEQTRAAGVAAELGERRFFQRVDDIVIFWTAAQAGWLHGADGAAWAATGPGS